MLLLLPLLALGVATPFVDARPQQRPSRFRVPRSPAAAGHIYPNHVGFGKRQLPAPVTGQTSITTPNGYTIRYKELTGTDICETTPGVRSFSGYVDLASDKHAFFYFFEARNNKSTAPITMWLNGGPGSDSAIGLYQENGPCRITSNLTAVRNPYSWNEISHMLYLSQPYGTGFSYSGKGVGVLDDETGVFDPTSAANATGRYPLTNASLSIDTTDEAGVAAWQIVQTFISALPSIDANVTTKAFNLATESYGGHYGPSFFDYFQQQNRGIINGIVNGTRLDIGSLTIINGIIDEAVQASSYPRFAVNNTYGIKAYNDTVLSYARFANTMINGCADQIEDCREVDRSTFSGQAVCTEAGNMCRDNVEGVYYAYSGRGVYDIREPYGNPELQDYFVDYLNLPRVQQALGVDLNYTESNSDIYWQFQQTGDFVYSTFLPDLVDIVNSGVRVSLEYGDADYICNWFGGEAVSLALNYTNAAQFRAAGYAPLVVNGTQYGETRQYGNFSFTRVYNSGHEVPFYQPVAALAMFRRTIFGLSMPDGGPLNSTSSSSGPATATHTSIFTGILPTTSVASMASNTTGSMSTGQATVTTAARANRRRRVANI